jgi:hypothetical protein
MKPKTSLHSFDELSHEVVKPDPDMPAAAYPESTPAHVREARRIPLPVQEQKDVDSGGYQHWGINE